MGKSGKMGSRLVRGETVLWDVIIFNLLLLGSLFLPYAHYTSKKVTYDVTGTMFLKGALIQRGAVRIPPQALLMVLAALAAVAILYAVLFARISKIRVSGTLLLVLGIAEFAAMCTFLVRIASIMDGARNPGAAYGGILAGLLCLLTLVRGFQILYANRVLGVLDFMLLPAALYFLVNNYFPMVGIFIAFKKIDYTKGIFASDWIGFENFKYLFATKDAWVMTRNTILYNVAFIVLGTILGIIVAIFLEGLFSKAMQKFYQTAILLPQLISIIIIAYIVFAFLSNDAGMVNKGILGSEHAINFYGTKIYWPFILIFVQIWKTIGYNSIIYFSGIVGINKDMYEAASIDGAGRLKQIFHITVPSLKPTIITLFIMQVGRIFYSDFGLFFQIPMNSGALFPVTQTIDTYVYRSLIELNNISMSSAASAYQSIVGFLVVIAANMIVRRVDADNAMF